MSHEHINPLIACAEGLARVAHRQQFDLSGRPYIKHVERVVERVRYCDPEVVAVAWLHDVVEDTDVTLTDIAAVFPPEIVQAVDAITQRPNEPLESYWARVKANQIAMIVKLHGDMPDNNDPARHTADNLPADKSDKIRNKYARAIKFFTTPDTFPRDETLVGVGTSNGVQYAWVRSPDVRLVSGAD